MSESIRLLLNGAPVAVAGVAPQTTLLEWLREQRRLVGTKEGCAEGDCGACTVVVAEADGVGLAWRPVNACLRLLPSLDGKAVFTVEGLQQRDGTLHPVQQALVECHGSQCGFCTPGFVMSLFALYKSVQAASRADVDDALSGNLCRCTGYRPILAAAQRMRELQPAEGWRAPGRAVDGSRSVEPEEDQLARQIRALARPAGLDYEGAGQRWIAPATEDALAAACAEHPDALLVAGATDVGLWVTKQHRDLGTLIHTGAARDLARIERSAEGHVIGAAASLADAFAALDEDFPELREAWERFASPPIRASGTLGGNVANGSPIGDSMPALIALGAKVVLRHREATRELPLEDFYPAYRQTALVPGEFVARIIVPPRGEGLLLRAWKVSKRRDQDISAVFACFALRLAGDGVESARIGCGGVAPVPLRARRTEAVLNGKPWSAELAEHAAQALADEFTPIDDMRASAAHRRAVLGNLMRRLWHESGDRRVPTRIQDVAAGEVLQ